MSHNIDFYYIFFMTMIGVICWLASGIWWWIGVFFLFSLLPAGLMFTVMFTAIVWAMLA